MLTPEDKGILKILGLLLLIVVLWVSALLAVIWTAQALDDGPAPRPSDWRK